MFNEIIYEDWRFTLVRLIIGILAVFLIQSVIEL